MRIKDRAPVTMCEKINKTEHLTHKIETVCVCVCSLIARERIHRFAPNLACLFLEIRNRIQAGKNFGKAS
jgi:hypothetical protein